MPKSMTLRLPDQQAAQLELIARIEGVAIAVVVREAIEAAIEARRTDQAFQTRVRDHLEEYRSQLDQLKDGVRQQDATKRSTVRMTAELIDIEAVVEAAKIVPPPSDQEP